MKHLLSISTAVMLVLASCSSGNKNGGVTLSFADGLPHPDTLFVEHSLIKDIIDAETADAISVAYDTVLWKDNAFRFAIDHAGASSYSFRISDIPSSESFFTLYTEPGESIDIKIKSLSPVTFSASGSKMMEGIAQISDSIAPVTAEYVKIMEREDADISEIKEVASRYVAVHSDFIRKNPSSPAAVYALLQVVGDDSYAKLFETLKPEARKSPLYHFAKLQYENLTQAGDEQPALQSLKVNESAATGFTLPNPEGKMVSLSDFKGKWVILDFWGSWCGWCVRGFPALKEAYAKYHPEGLEIIGIDCSDTDAEWREALAKYELPWVQVFNGEDRSLLEAYGINSFPTKVIVNPEGIVANVTIGEEPAFFNALADLLKEKQ